MKKYRFYFSNGQLERMLEITRHEGRKAEAALAVLEDGRLVEYTSAVACDFPQDKSTNFADAQLLGIGTFIVIVNRAILPQLPLGQKTDIDTVKKLIKPGS